MHFVDEVELTVSSGKGGKGAVAFRREKFVPFGGPSGGDGGRGGHVIVEADPQIQTLLDFRYRKKIIAKNGENGRTKDQYGAAGPDTVLRIPVGTQIYDAASGMLLYDLTEARKRFVIAEGGRGGRGNIHFATPTNRAPRHSEPGGPAVERQLRLELKLFADVGLVGFPNAGKSTLIAALSRAKPKIADYPFTTLVPNLGVVATPSGNSFVMADIPGIVEGASEGHGLGLRFLRHIERTKLLLFVIAPACGGPEALDQQLDLLRQECERYTETLLQKPGWVVCNKADLGADDSALAQRCESLGLNYLGCISAVSHERLDALCHTLDTSLMELKATEVTLSDAADIANTPSEEA